MRQLIAISAVVALLVASAYAPLFHMHTDANEAATEKINSYERCMEMDLSVGAVIYNDSVY